MPISHKNKTLATLLAALFGGLGAHRFYLFGKRDFWAWVHFLSLPVSLLALYRGGSQPWLFLCGLLVLSVLSGLLEALVIGLTPDEKWDQRHNPASGKASESGWPLAILLVLTTGIGATGLIWVIARSFDLLFTGGAYG